MSLNSVYINFFLITLSFHHRDDEILISHRSICIRCSDLERAEAGDKKWS